MGRLGAAIAPATIGFIAAGGSFTMAFIVMGTAYFIAGVIPGLFIRERQYDPQQSSLVKPVEAQHGDSVGSVTTKKPTRPATASQ